MHIKWNFDQALPILKLRGLGVWSFGFLVSLEVWVRDRRDYYRNKLPFQKYFRWVTIIWIAELSIPHELIRKNEQLKKNAAIQLGRP